MPMDRDEVALLSRIGQRDRAALERLYKAYRSKLLRFALRVVRGPEDAEEVVNDVFFVVWKEAAKFEGRSRVSTWLMGIAYRQALKRLRREASYLRVIAPGSTAEGEEDAGANAPAADAGPSQRLITDELADVALAALSPDQRLMVELAMVLGHSYPEIAVITDCPVNTVKTRIFHARKRMREALARAGAGDGLSSVVGE